jgi:SpoVK/Ycf46/Vps4 family AAA+-type ATPase
VAVAAQGFSGAEIDAAIQTAMYAAYSGNSDLTTETVLQALKGTVPLSVSRAEEIDELRQWAKHRAVPASVPDKVGQSA